MIATFLIGLIRLYQLTLSRLLVAAFGPACRFEPSCSRYAVACLEGHGAVRGTLLSVRRLCKCHPFHRGGYDPPPPPTVLPPSDSVARAEKFPTRSQGSTVSEAPPTAQVRAAENI
jgi:putative membrane protein insertion efficiency factor